MDQRPSVAQSKADLVPPLPPMAVDQAVGERQKKMKYVLMFLAAMLVGCGKSNQPTNGQRVQMTVHNQRGYAPPSEWAEGGTNAWFYGFYRMQLQDEHGQVYYLSQVRSNSNIYAVYQSMDDTNGITNSFSYRMGWWTNGNWVINADSVIIVEFPAITNSPTPVEPQSE